MRLGVSWARRDSVQELSRAVSRCNRVAPTEPCWPTWREASCPRGVTLPETAWRRPSSLLRLLSGGSGGSSAHVHQLWAGVGGDGQRQVLPSHIPKGTSVPWLVLSRRSHYCCDTPSCWASYTEKQHLHKDSRHRASFPSSFVEHSILGRWVCMCSCTDSGSPLRCHLGPCAIERVPLDAGRPHTISPAPSSSYGGRPHSSGTKCVRLVKHWSAPTHNSLGRLGWGIITHDLRSHGGGKSIRKEPCLGAGAVDWLT